MGGLRKRKRNLWIAAFLWAALICVLSMEPVWVLWLILPGEIYFILSHAVAYSGLVFLICLLLTFQKSFLGARLNLRGVLAVSFLLSVLWGGFNEWMQLFTPDRNPSWQDFGADVAGSFVGLWCFVLFKKILKRVKPDG